MWEGITWLDLLGFAVNVLTAVVALRLEWREIRELRAVRKKERDIERKLDSPAKE